MSNNFSYGYSIQNYAGHVIWVGRNLQSHSWTQMSILGIDLATNSLGRVTNIRECSIFRVIVYLSMFNSPNIILLSESG